VTVWVRGGEKPQASFGGGGTFCFGIAGRPAGGIGGESFKNQIMRGGVVGTKEPKSTVGESSFVTEKRKELQKDKEENNE